MDAEGEGAPPPDGMSLGTVSPPPSIGLTGAATAGAADVVEVAWFSPLPEKFGMHWIFTKRSNELKHIMNSYLTKLPKNPNNFLLNLVDQIEH